MLGLISERGGHQKLAAEYFERAGGGLRGRKSSAAKRKLQSEHPMAAPLFRLSTGKDRRLITGGDRRLAEALRQDALKACSLAYSDGR